MAIPARKAPKMAWIPIASVIAASMNPVMIVKDIIPPGHSVFACIHGSIRLIPFRSIVSMKRDIAIVKIKVFEIIYKSTLPV